MTLEKMRFIIDSHLSTLYPDSYVEIGFYGGSFTGIEKEQQIQFLKTAYEYIEKGRVREIRLSTRPDYISEEILEPLKRYGVRTVELGAQSLDSDVLSKSCRGHSVEDVIRSSRLIKEFGFALGIQTMIGLPGDDKEKDLSTAGKVVQIGPEIVRIYPTLVIRGTYLEKMFAEGLFRPLSMDEAVQICAELQEIYEGNNIHVIRIGLQPTDSINEKSDVIAGPFHPAFRQLTDSKRALNSMERQIEIKQLKNEKKILVYTHEKNLSNVIGQKKSNILFLREKYHFENIIVRPITGLNSGGLTVEKLDGI